MRLRQKTMKKSETACDGDAGMRREEAREGRSIHYVRTPT